MPAREHDAELAAIQRLYRELTALRYHIGKNRESPEYRSLVRRIRALVDARTARRGNEMIVVSDPCQPKGVPQ